MWKTNLCWKTLLQTSNPAYFRCPASRWCGVERQKTFCSIGMCRLRSFTGPYKAIIYFFFCWNILCIWVTWVMYILPYQSCQRNWTVALGRRSSQEYRRSWELQGSEVTAVRFIHAFDIDVCHFVNNKSAHIQLGYTGYTRYIHIQSHTYTHTYT